MTPAADLFAAGGQTGALMARVDWAGTPVGPVAQWPESLRAAVRLVLSSRYPMLLLWGSNFTQLYNDAYSALIGDKHPAALGCDVRITLAEGWDVLGPIIDEAMRTGVASWVPALQLRLERAGYAEEAYFSVSHAAARDDSGATVGVFAVCSEVTDQVVGERRLSLLRDLALGAEHTRTVERTCTELLATVADHPLDVPFAAVYLRDGAALRRLAAVGAQVDGAPVDAELPTSVTLDPTTGGDRWGLGGAAAGRATAVPDVADRLAVAAGPWGDQVGVALALPLPSVDPTRPLGVLLVGVSPNRGLDEPYRSFLDLLAQQVSVAVRNARAYEEERRRTEALAELDRVKTSFFTNVSHEFRTPLTLMLGPLADALADADDPLSAGQRERVDTARRNATRLLKLVNSLLTFASLEAGRAARTPEPVDLAAVTTDVASVFRAAVERAGLRLVVDCPPLPEPVNLDPGHWETIVANLLSNALKFTFVGQIRVALQAEATAVRLTVSDTGIGIAPQDLPRLFERFHRVQGTRARSHEGTGIGLALVQELTRLQGGEVRVASQLGAGTTFTVELPWSAVRAPGPAAPGGPGRDSAEPAAPAPARPAGAEPAAARLGAAEAMQWLATGPAREVAPRGTAVVEASTAADPAGPRPGQPPADPLAGARVMVADDNADMRGYVGRLLSEQGWQVHPVADGQEALEQIRRQPPDLLLTDVMMPRLDGFHLVRELRRDPRTQDLPIVVLSARAGREASVEGLEVGADDYVVKPFSATDLVARLRTTMLRARGRAREAERAGGLGAADAATLIRAGQALESSVRLFTAQARAVLDADQAVTTLTDGQPGPPVRITVPADNAVDPPSDGAPAPVTVPVPGPLGVPLATVAVRRAPDSLADPADEQRLAPVGRLLAVLLTGIRHPEREADVAAALQRGLLPDTLPDIPGWELVARYLPAGVAEQLGGDWYDACPLPDGRVAVSVGDVAGRGILAVSLMAHLRYALRASARLGEPPAQALTRLGDLLHRLRPGCFATVFFGHLDPRTGVLQWCSAGHPPPWYEEPGQPGRWLSAEPAAPVGVLTRTPRTHHVTLPPGARLVLYTDGLTRAAPVSGGDRMPPVGPGTSLAGPAGQVREAVDAILADSQDNRRDDIVILALGRGLVEPPREPGPVADVEQVRSYPANPHAAATARRDLRAVLNEANVDDDDVFELLTAVSEAVNNAVEHAQQPTRPEVTVALTVLAGTARVTVRDFGSWRGRQPAMDRGRGAALMSAYADVQVVAAEDGTTVIIERPVAGRR